MIESTNKSVKEYMVSFILNIVVDTDIICNTALVPGPLPSVEEISA